MHESSQGDRSVDVPCGWGQPPSPRTQSVMLTGQGLNMAYCLLLVGDLSKIEAGIRKLNLGEIVVLDVEGRLK